MRSARILGPGLTLALALPLSARLSGQMHHVDKPQRVTRAIGVYEWTGDIKKPDAARLIPVSVFINSHFEDAGVFLAEPIPLALETGNVYAVQHSGDPVGTLDLDYARNIVDRRSTADDNPIGAWYGYGRFLPLEAQPVEKLTQHSAHPAAVVSSDPNDDRPHFINRSPGEAENSTPTAGSSTASANTPAPPDDPDRPTMTKRDAGAGSGANSTDNAPSSPGTGDIDNDPDRPTLGHRTAPPEGKKKKQKDSGSGVEPMATSLNDDPNRPEIHRGKIVSASAPPQLTGIPPNLHQAIAVSDAANNPTHVFTREWGSPTERASALADMQQIAQPIAQQYLIANHLQPAPVSAGPQLVTAPAKPASNKTASNRTTSKTTASKTTPKSRTATHRAAATAAPAPLAFTNEQLAGYTLSYGGLPTFVYTAQVPTTNDQTLYVTIVAQRLPAGGLQTSLTSVTDSTHLDRIPWMRLIDAVDPDDSHRASLLFELRAKSSRQFALYSLTSAQAQQSFVTGIIE